MNSHIKEIEHRTKSYWWEDGLPEIAFGAVFMVMAAYYFFASHIRPQWALIFALAVGNPAIMILSMYLAGKAVKALKTKITYPRTGYVSYRRRAKSERRKRMIRGGVIGILVALFVNLLMAFLGRSSVWVFSGAVMAATLLFIGYQFTMQRFYILAALVFLLGVYTGSLGHMGVCQASIFIGGSGVLAALSGLVKLLLYLKHTEPVQEDSNAG